MTVPLRMLVLVLVAACSAEVSLVPNDDPVCGNGVLEGPEICDDGNTVDTDTCTAICQPADCGDGIVQRGVEACDDGNDDDTDDCVAGCVVATCGDGIIHAGVEACDDGDNNGVDGGTCFPDCRTASVALTAETAAVDPMRGTAGEPAALYPGDLDGDGVPDLGVLLEAYDYGSGNFGTAVMRMVNGGGGTLWAPWVDEEGLSFTGDITLGDFDEDGRADLLMPGDAFDYADVVVWYAGQDQGLAPGQMRPTEAGSVATDFSNYGPRERIVADLNTDGHLDVITINVGDGSDVSILLGDGDGGLTPVAQLTLRDPANLREAVLADVTGDGRPDLVATETSGPQVVVFPRTGALTFGTASLLKMDVFPSTIGPFDLDHDGDAEILVFSYATSDPLVLDWDRSALVDTGTLDLQPSCTPVGVAPAVGDVDGDGLDDLLVECGIRTGLLTHTTTPGVPRFEALTCDRCGGLVYTPQPKGVALADADGDGALDALAVWQDGDIAIWWSDGTQPGGTPDRLFVDLWYRNFVYMVGIGAADVTGDGVADLVGTTLNGPYVLPGLGGRRFPVPGGMRASQLKGVGLADTDGDGPLDFVGLMSWYRDDFPVRTVSGLVTYAHRDLGLPAQLQQTLEVDDGTGALIGHDVKGFASGPVDGDAFDDIAWVSDVDDVFVFRFGDGAGDFDRSAIVETVSPGVDRVFLADADGDGVLDLFGLDPTAGIVEARLGRGDASFGLPVFVSAGPGGAQPVDLLVRDLDGDALAELVIVNRGGGNVAVARATAPLAWSAPVLTDLGSTPTAADLGDVDGDGLLDLVVASDAGVHLFLGFGNAAFAAPVAFPAGDAPRDVVLIDLDGDGLDDVVTANHGSDDLTVLYTGR